MIILFNFQVHMKNRKRRDTIARYASVLSCLLQNIVGEDLMFVRLKSTRFYISCDNLMLVSISFHYFFKFFCFIYLIKLFLSLLKRLKTFSINTTEFFLHIIILVKFVILLLELKKSYFQFFIFFAIKMLILNV